jgi:hypothetical protein
MNHKAALARKLVSLPKKIATYEALMAFLKKHPAVASRTTVLYPSNNPALCFMEKAMVKTAHDKKKRRVVLPSERWVEDGNWDDRLISEDVSRLSRKELDKVLKKVKINLRKPKEDDDEL